MRKYAEDFTNIGVEKSVADEIKSAIADLQKIPPRYVIARQPTAKRTAD